MPRILALDAPGGKIGGWVVVGTLGVSPKDAGKKTCTLLDHGVLLLETQDSELSHFTQLHKLLDKLYAKYTFRHIVFEHPFLYRIAQWIGAYKLWVAMHHQVRWYMIGASSARKTVLGAAPKMKAKDAKALVKARVESYFGIQLTQHEADAGFYALAFAIKQNWETPLQQETP